MNVANSGGCCDGLSLEFVLKLLLYAGTALGVAVLNLGAQERVEYGSVPRQKTVQSQAEMEADQFVSLSADKIIQLLRDEPGLLLQVKKRLVRKAFEQGRLLDPADLNDEALFRLLKRRRRRPHPRDPGDRRPLLHSA